MLLENFFKEKQIREFEEKLLQNSNKKISVFLKESIFAGLLTALLIALGGFFIKIEHGFIIIASIGAVLAGMTLMVLWQLYLFEKNKRAKELLVPDALLQASMFPEKTDIAKIVQYLGRASYGLLGKEFRKVRL
jgi:hypothetical protein